MTNKKLTPKQLEQLQAHTDMANRIIDEVINNILASYGEEDGLTGQNRFIALADLLAILEDK